MQILFDGIASVLATFYSVVPDYAFAIVALTLGVMAITTPLTLKSTRSMMLMQQMQPEIKRIQSQYKDDRQKLNEELMRFYRENNLSPAGGCLPMVVQMPVFIVLYQVLRGLTRRVSDLGFATGFNVGQLASAADPTKAPPTHMPFDPAYVSHSTDLFANLSTHSRMLSLGIDLAQSPSEAVAEGVAHALPYIALIAVVAFTGWYQQKQISGRTPAADQNPQQQMLMKIMPFFLPVISFTLPAGLVLYFVVSNLCRVGLQAYISHSIYGIRKGEGPPTPAGASSASTNTGGGGSGGKKPAKGGRVTPKAGSADAEDRTPGKGGSGKNGSGKGKVSAPDADRDTPSKVAPPSRAGRSAGSARASGNGSNAEASKPNGAKANGSKAGGSAGNGARSSSSAKKDASGTATGAGATSAPAPTPTLQPRARKPKKR